MEGELEVLDGEGTFTAKAGSVLQIPRSTMHSWRNATTKPARTLLFITPAGFEGCLEEAGGTGERSLLPATACDTTGVA